MWVKDKLVKSFAGIDLLEFLPFNSGQNSERSRSAKTFTSLSFTLIPKKRNLASILEMGAILLSLFSVFVRQEYLLHVGAEFLGYGTCVITSTSSPMTCLFMTKSYMDTIGPCKLQDTGSKIELTRPS